MTTIIDPNHVHLEDFQGFSCTLCGRCCRRPWRVVVEPEVEQDVRGSEVMAAREREGYVSILVSPEDGKLRLGRRENGSCLFMDESTQGCELHLEVGLERKPLGCQMFPYRGVRTPTGTYFYQSWACPPVVEGLGDNAEEIREQLRRLLQNFPEAPADLPNYDQPVRLTPKVHISWASYLQLEKRLEEGYRADRPLESILAMAVTLLGLASAHPEGDIEEWPDLSDAKALVRNNFPVSSAEATGRQDASEAVYTDVNKEEATQPAGMDPCSKWGSYSGPEPKDDLSFERSLLGLYACIAIAVIETEHEPERRNEVHEALLNKERVVSHNLGLTLPVFDVDAPQPTVLREPFERYFRNVLSGKLLLTPSIGARLLTVAASYAMLIFYAEAFREKRGESEITLEALVEAFDIVEQELSHYTHLECFFLDCEETLGKLAGT